MKFYHGTSKEAWKGIQREGVLWGIRNAPSRCTYLTPDEAVATIYGGVILEAEYDPIPGVGVTNNYHPDSWQMRVYEPIPIKNVKFLYKLSNF